MSDDVARYFRRKHLEIDPTTNEPRGVVFTSLKLRDHINEKELSTSHLQFFAGSTKNQLSAAKAERLAAAFDVYEDSAFAVLGVGEIETTGKRYQNGLSAFRSPSRKLKSHASIHGLPPNNSRQDLLEDLARSASQRFFPAKTL